MLSDPTYDHVSLDISWNEVARYVVRDDESLGAWAALMEKHPTRFLFGTDSVAPADWDEYVKTYSDYGPLWERLKAGTRERIERLNYERIFDAAIAKVRAWERDHLVSASR